MDDWTGLGHDLAISTLDLSGFPESLRADDSELVAGYLGRVLHHVGFLGLQSISNDGSVRDPYVHFAHDVGSIVIAPSGPAADAPWKFTSATVQHIPEVFMAVSELPPAADAPPRLTPPMVYFKLREFMQENVPALMFRMRRLEAWQVIPFAFIMPPLVLLMRAVSGLLVRQLRRIPGAPAHQPRLLPWALTVVLVGTAASPLPGIFGIPAYSRQFTVPVLATLLFSGSAFLAWYVVSLVGGVLQARAARTARSSDDLAVSLLLACARIAIVFIAVIKIAYYFSLPTESVLAGVGLGGLAVAFASRETLTNLFGAGVIMADRPFRRGDWIDCSFARGFIEDVGIRSTRVRTADDSLVVVPNGKLAGAIINNLGKRRVRHLAVDLDLADGATPSAVDAFIAGVRSHIAGNSVFTPNRTEIGVTELGCGGTAHIELRGYLSVTTDGAEAKARHALLIELQRIAAASGVKLDNSRIVSVKPPGAGGDDGDDDDDPVVGS
jgi:MscS family membrane protein